ncbi:MAG: dihydrofolate reductase [Rhizobiales bacterium]|nr:dihydrofolate reductase [Hyphomicrobiales bacterium]
MSIVSLVVAVSRNGVIGRDGGLPWHISSDLRRFKAVTMGKPVIMGRKTWESLPKKPLPGRTNIIVTRQAAFEAAGALVAADVDAALALAALEQPEEICVIGGGEIYRQTLPHARRIHLTEVDMDVEGDTRFPSLSPSEWREVSREEVKAGPSDSADFVVRVLERA